ISDNAKLLSYFNTGIEIQNVRFASSIRGAGAVDVKHRQLSPSGEAKKRSIGIGRVYAVIGDAGNDPDQLLRTPHHRRKLSDQLLLDSISHSWRTGFQSWCLCLDLNALRYLAKLHGHVNCGCAAGFQHHTGGVRLETRL